MLRVGSNITDPALLAELPVGSVVAASLKKNFIKTGPDLYSSGVKAFSAAQLTHMGFMDPGLIVLHLGN
jgi:hypothetical protein